MDAEKMDLTVQSYAVAGKTIVDAVADNPNAKVILNGPLFNYRLKEPGVTTGVVLNNSVVEPTSTSATKASYKVAGLRFWFGQVRENGAAQNDGKALSYEFGEKHPTIPTPPLAGTDLDAAMGGLYSAIWKDDDDEPVKVTAKMDADLAVFDKVTGSWYGFSFIGVDRDRGLLIVLSKKNKVRQSFWGVGDKLFDSGCERVLCADGGSSTALVAGGTYVVKSQRHRSPNAANTVPNYFVFSPIPAGDGGGGKP